MVVAVGFGTSLGGFFADTFPWVSLLIGLIGTLVVATLLDLAVTRHDNALRLLHELELKNSQLDQALSRQVQAELSLRQAQRMEAVGQLAGGIAHDFNNLLQSILSYSEFLSDAIDPDSELQDDVAEVRKAAQRAAGLTRQLQVFSRQPLTDPVVANLNDSIRGAEHLIRTALGEDIDLICTTPEYPCLVWADMAELEQMLMNLALNARDAMVCGGQIEIKVDMVDSLGSENLSAAPGSGQFARIDVRDNGNGMPPEVAAKAFEPFFTTKETGRGAGLGLAMVYGIANRAGGSASITSVVGEGTTVTVLFPLSNQDETTSQRAGQLSRRRRAPQPRKNAGAPVTLTTTFPRSSPEARILVVDDEEPIRRSLVRVLDRAGYVCATAASAAEARHLLTKDEFDLMLCDVTMPGESGFSLLAHAHEVQPDLAVMMVTAVETREVVQPAIRQGAYGYILKPFDTNMILINVVGALRARAQSISEQRPKSQRGARDCEPCRRVGRSAHSPGQRRCDGLSFARTLPSTPQPCSQSGGTPMLPRISFV